MLLINFVSIAGEEQDLILKRRALNIFQRKNALKKSNLATEDNVQAPSSCTLSIFDQLQVTWPCIKILKYFY